MRALIVSAAMVLLLAAASAKARTWTDSSGAFTVEAELVGVDGDRVRLKRPDGRVLEVPVARLSRDDREYLAKQSRPARTDKQGKLLAALDAAAPVDFVETPLAEALAFVASAKGIDLVIDRPEFQKAGIATDVPVTLSTDQLTLAEVLDAVLGASGLGFYTLDGVLVVTSKKRAELAVYPRVYKYRKGLNPRNLMTELTRNIAPRSWSDVGGPASLERMTFCVVIAQTRAAHGKIEEHYAELLAPIDLPRAEPDKALAAKFPLDKLDRPVRCQFVETPLGQVAATLGDLGGVPVMLDARALQAAGVAADTKVTLALADTRFQTALDLLCRQLGAAWTASSDRALITDRATAEKSVELVSYPARDLASRGRLDLIGEVITTTIVPRAWDDVGGSGQVRGGMRGTLDVRQTVQVHRQVNRLLAEIRAARRR